MTDQHTADTEYQNGHAPPMYDIPATVKLSEPAPKPDASRPWPLAARLTVAVLVIGLATIAALSLMSIRTVTARANQASQQAAAEAVSLAAMGRQLAAVQARVATPAPKLHLPAGLQHYGLCMTRTTNSATGDLANITLSAPVMTGGSYSCPQGNFVSVVPGP